MSLYLTAGDVRHIRNMCQEIIDVIDSWDIHEVYLDESYISIPDDTRGLRIYKFLSFLRWLHY